MTQRPKARAEITGHVRVSPTNVRRIHVMTLHAASWGSTYADDAASIRMAIATCGLSKKQALVLRDRA